MIGVIFVILALVLGELGLTILALIPNSVLGVLLVFAGLELCPLVRSLQTNTELMVMMDTMVWRRLPIQFQPRHSLRPS